MFKLFSTTAAIRICGAGSQVLFTFSITWNCATEEAGLFFFSYALVVILSTFARFGTEISGIRIVAMCLDKHSIEAMRQATNSRLLLVSLVATAISFGLILFAPLIARYSVSTENAISTIRLMGATIPALATLGLVGEFLKGAGQFQRSIFLINVVPPGVTAIILFILANSIVLDSLNVASVLCGVAWFALAVAIGSWRAVLLRNKVGNPPRCPIINRGELRQILRDAPSLTVLATTSIIIQWLGALLLGFLSDPANVVGYSVASRLAIAVSVVHSAAASVAGPQLSVAHINRDHHGLKRISHTTALIISSMTLPVLLVLGLKADLWLSIFGRDYWVYAGVLQILLVGQVVASLLGHTATILVMCGFYDTARLTSLVAIFVFTLVSAVLIPPLGAYGAAIAMTSTVVAGHVTGFLLVRRKLGIWAIPLTRSDFEGVLRQSNLSV